MSYYQSPDQDTQRRIIEVVFYLITQTMYQRRSTNSYESKQLLQSLSEFFGCKPTTLNVAYQNMVSITHAPSPSERVVALKYLDFPIRKIARVLDIHHNTVYKYLSDYERNGAIGLAPRFDLETDRELLKFNKQMFQIFGGVSEILTTKEAEQIWK